MGALSYEPADPDTLPDEDVKLLDVARQVQTAVDGTDAEVLRRLMLLGGSPQGARPKALVYYDPVSGVMRTQAFENEEPWLVKFPANGEHKDACALEYAYAQLAVACGLEMPQTRYFDLDSRHAAFGIQRFDRLDGMRVPMHTLAGFLHADFRIPSVDYTTFLRATRAITHDEREVAKAFRRVVFNVAFNNRDDHVKNFAYCLDKQRQWKLAPAYDLTFNEGPGGEHQMDVCGEARAPGRAELLRLADEAAVPVAEARGVIDLIASVASNLKVRLADHPIRKLRQREVVRVVEANLVRLV
jgi:serine/threonine-protein kinase HipA